MDRLICLKINNNAQKRVNDSDCSFWGGYQNYGGFRYDNHLLAMIPNRPKIVRIIILKH